MTENDRPPERIWLDDKALSAHFEGVQDRYRTGSDPEWQAIPDQEFQQNELTAQFRR